MLQPLHSLDITVHAAALLGDADAGCLGCDGPALLVSTAHEVMLHDMRLGCGERAVLRRLGGGYEMPAGVLLRPGTQTLLVADLHPALHQFTLYAAPLHAADQRQAQPLLRTSGQPLQLALAGSTLYYADHHRGALMAVDIDSPSTLLPREVLSRLESPVGVALADGGREVLISERRPGRVTSAMPGLLAASTTLHPLQVWQVERGGLHSPQLLSVDEASGMLLLPQFASFGFVQGMDLASGKVQNLIRLAAHQRPLAAWRLRDWLIVAETGGIRCWNRAEAVAALRPPADTVLRAQPASGSSPGPALRAGIPQPAEGL
jgi:hypothetical protein